MKRTIILALAAASISCHADEWTGQDKAKHFAVSAAIGAAIKASTDLSDNQALALAMVPGLLKEANDSRQGGSGWSNKDIVWNLAGAYVGIKATGWMLSHSRGQTFVGYKAEF